MRIDQLRLVNYRNYADLSLRPEAGLNVLTGDNAAGKTNVLEAMFLCALGRSHRTPHDQELLRRGERAGSVRVALTTAGGSRAIDCRLQQGESKQLRIDGAPLSRSGELLGCLNVVLFAPEDMALVKGGPGERRRFLDMELSQLKPSYYYALQRYNAALKQRNALLKDPSDGTLDTIGLWDEQLSGLGAAIMAARVQFVDQLCDAVHALHRRISDGREQLVAAYRPSVRITDKTNLKDVLARELADGLERDIYRGFTSVGPHRDDLALLLDGADVRVYGSQGQQRTAVLSLKLSELSLLENARGEPPVLLLDDVFSELDRRRQRMLLQSVAGCQTFVTCTHLEALSAAGVEHMQVYHVKDGRVTEA